MHSLPPTLHPLVRPYLGHPQQQALLYALNGAEAATVDALLATLVATVQSLPRWPSAPDADPLLSLHYFQGDAHWYITEQDSAGGAFGFLVLNGDVQNATPYYIDRAELVLRAVELDLYWSPLTLGALNAQLKH